MSGVGWGYGVLQAWQPYGLGLQVSPGLGDEVSLCGSRWSCRATVPRAAARDGSRARDGRACRVHQSGPRAHAVVDPAQPVGIACGAVPERAQLAQAAERVRDLA